MSITLAPSRIPITRKIKPERLVQILGSESALEAAKMGLVDRILDTLTGGVKSKACKELFVLLKQHKSVDFSTAAGKVKAYRNLTQLVGEQQRKKLRMELETDLVNGETIRTVKFSIEGVADFHPQVKLLPPEKVAQGAEDLIKFKLKKSAESLLLLQQAKVTTRQCHKDVAAQFRCWNRAIKEMQAQAQQQAAELQQGKADIKFDLSSLQEALVDMPDAEIPNHLVSLWQSIPHGYRANNGYEASSSALGSRYGYNPDKITAQVREIRKNYSQRRIKKSYIEYKCRRDELRAQALEKKHTEKLIEMRSKSREGASRTYLVDPQGILPTVRKPLSKSNPINAPLSGKAKERSSDDGEFISLSPTSANSRLLKDFSRKRNEGMRKLWTDIKAALGDEHMKQGCSIIPAMLGLMDETKTIHAASGGVDIIEFLAHTRKPLPKKVYKQACKDLTKLHAAGIYLRDIKNENLMLKRTARRQDGKEVETTVFEAKFIDLDDALTPTYGEKTNPTCTADKITSKLWERRIKGDEQALRSGDYYAMIMTMFEGVTLNEIRPPHDIPFKTGVFTDANENNKYALKCFLQAHIKREHYYTVKKFMENPVRHPLPAKVEFWQLFNWEDEPEGR